MAIWNATAELIVTPTVVPAEGLETGLDAAIDPVTVSLTGTATSTNPSAALSANALLTAEAYVWKGLVSGNQGSFTIRCRGQMLVETKTLPFYGPPVGTVNNIEDLPGSAPDGTVYNVAGTAANREPIDAIYSTLSSSWIYQPPMSGRNTTKITHINPLIGTNITMPDYINFNGIPHTPAYWDKTTISDSFSYSLIDIVNPDVQAVEPAGRTIWKWMVEDLSPVPAGSTKYSLAEWREHSGTGPTWHSKSWYRPQVKETVKFNIKKNKTRKQRSVVFNNSNVDHMWMEIPGGWEQPFTIVFAGIIHSYPTAKFGHYLLDTGGELPVYVKAATEGKDYFPNEGLSPRNGMLFMKRSAKMGCDDHFDSGPRIRIKHTEKARPRTFYGVFNGANSIFGFKDNKTKGRGTGTVSDYGVHRYFVTGRRTNRISDNRASHMSLWEIVFINDALTIQEIDGICHELAEKYQYKKYS